MRQITVFFFIAAIVYALPPGPTGMMRIPVHESWAGCTTQAISIVIKDDFDKVDTSSIQLRVKGILYPWSHIQLAWVDDSILVWTPAAPFVNGETVPVVLESANDTSGQPLQGAPLNWEFYMDFDFPFFLPETRYPPPGTTICSVDSIAIKVLDSTSGIPHDGLCMCVNANNYSCSPLRSNGYCWQPSLDPNFIYSDSIFYIPWSYFSSFDDEEVIEVCLRKVVDSVGVKVGDDEDVCGPHWFDTLDVDQCWSFTRDCLGPRAELVFPNEGDTTACDSIIIVFTDLSDIDTLDVTLRIGPLSYQIRYSDDFNASANGDTALFIGNLPEGNVVIHINRAKDKMGNVATTMSFPYWSIFVDKSPPSASNPLPPEGSTAGSSTPAISVAIDDAGTSVEPNSITLEVDGTPYSFPHPALSWDGSRIIFSPIAAGVSFNDGDTVDVCLTGACDMVRSDRCGPNCLTTPFCWWFTIDQGGPQAELVLPPVGGYSACDDQGIVFHLWDQSGVDSITITMQVEGTTYDTMDHFTYLNDTLTFAPTTNWINGQEVNWTLSEAKDYIGNSLTTPLSGNFFIDLMAPFITDEQPLIGTRFGPSYLTVVWTLIDVGAGVDPNSAIVSVQGSDYPYPTGFSWDGSDLSFDISSTGLGFSDGDTVIVCLHVGDSVPSQFCGPNWRDSCIYFIADLAGPIADMVYPQDSVITACSSGVIKIFTQDIDRIDRNTLQVQINSASYNNTSPQISWNGDTMIFTPSIPFTHGDTIDVVLVALSDTLGNGLTAPGNWFFAIDTQTPEIISCSPAHDAEISSTTPIIRIRLEDEPAGVDTTSIVIRIDGTEYSVGDLGCTWSADRVVFDCGIAGLSFGDGDTVEVCLVSVSDNVSSSYCGPNSDSPDSCWFFRVDLAGPTTDLLLPLDGAYTSCADQEIRIFIFDIQGVIPESTAIAVNSDTFAAWLGEITMEGDTAVYNPSPLFTDGEEVTVQVVHATDSLGNTTTGGDIWNFTVDLTPPLWLSTSPPAESFLDVPDPIITLSFIDSISGVNPTTFKIRIDGSPFVGMLPGIIWLDPPFEIDPAMLFGSPYSDSDTIVFCFDSLLDNAFYCGANELAPDSCWRYFIDLSGATATLERPADGAFFACEFGTLIVVLTDNFGIDDTTVRLSVDGVGYSISHDYMWINGDTIYFSPDAGWTDGDTIPVQVTAALDVAGNPLESSDFWEFIIDLTGPEIVSADPPGGTILSVSSPILHAEVNETGSGVDESSIEILVDGVPASGGISYESATGIITIDFTGAGLSFNSGDTIDVCYRVDDLVLPEYCGPNTADSVCYTYSFDLAGPTASVIQPDPDSYTSCNDQNILILLIDDYSVNNGSIHLRIEGNDFMLSDTNLSYIGDTLLQFYPPAALPEDEINVTLWGVTDGAGNPLAGDSLVFSFFTDYTPPYLTSGSPAPGEVVSDTEVVITVGLSDDGSSVRDSSITINVTGAALTLADGCMDWDGSTATLTLTDCDIIFTDGDTVDICVRASDNPDYCPPNAMSDTCWFFIVSSQGPMIEIVEPEDGDITACPDQPILIELLDDNGIDDSSIQLSVDGTVYTTADMELAFHDDTLRFMPSTDWSDGVSIPVELITVSDITGLASPDIPIAWSFTTDFSPPYVTGVNPPDGTDFSVGDTIIAVALTDDVSGVNDLTIRVRIGAYMYSYPGGDMTYDGDTLHFSLSGLGITPIDGDTMTICIQNTSDNPDLCDPNVMEPFCFDYYFDYRGPAVNLMFPPESIYVSCFDSSIVWTIWDAAGVDSASLIANINGTPIELSSPLFSLSGTYLTFDPDTDFIEGIMFPVEITTVDDAIGNSTGPLTWWVGFDTTAPVIANPVPPDDGLCPTTTPVISVEITDNATDVYPYWARLFINDTDTIYAVLGEMDWDGLHLSTDLAALGIYLAAGETITICIDSVFDEAFGCGKNIAEPFCWNFVVDEGGPSAILLSPPDNAISSCDEDSIIIRLRDNNGVEWTSTRISVDGSIYEAISAPVAILDDSTIAFIPAFPFADGETIEIFVVETADTLGNVSSSHPHWEITFDTSPPEISALDPPDSAFIGDSWQCDIIDATAGVDTESIEITVNGSALVFSRVGDHIDLDISGLGFADGDTVDICITALDFVNWCPPNELNECFQYYVDHTPPDGALLYPASGAISACSDQSIVWILTDIFSVDLSTILVDYEGDTIDIDDSRLTYSDDTLILAPGALIHGDTVRATLISASDIAGNNAVITSSTWFVIDLLPPVFTGSIPADSSEIGNPSPTIRLYLDDDISGVNPDSITVTLNGSPVTLVWDGIAAIVDCEFLGIEFADGETVTACISAFDSPDLCAPNALPETCIVFIMNLAGPLAEIIEPVPGSYYACDEGEQNIALTIEDDDGVDEGTILFVVDSDTFDTGDFELTYTNDTLAFVPPAPWSDGETISCALISAIDTAGNDLASPLSWSFIIDIAPPGFTSPDPEEDSFVPDLAGGISIDIIDEGSGVNDSSIALWIEGGIDTFTLINGLIWDGMRAAVPESLLPALGGMVTVCVTANDQPAYCGPNVDTVCWNFSITAEGPLAYAISPTSGQIISCDESEQELVIYLHSDIGVDEPSISLEIDGIPVSGIYAGDTLRYSPSIAWAHGDTVRVSLTADDIFGNTMAVPLEFWFVIDIMIPNLGMPYPPLSGYMDFELYDFPAGIDTESIEVVVTTASGTLYPDFTYLPMDSILRVDILSEDPYFSFSDTFEICISASDRAELCGTNILDSVCNWDVLPPFYIFTPLFGDISSCDDQGFFTALPVPTGLDDIAITVNDDTLSMIDIETGGDTVYYNPALPYSSGDTVQVDIIGAYDSTGLLFHADTSFWYVIDLDPPVAFSPSPADGEEIPTPSPVISLVLIDSIAGVDAPSILIVINGDIFTIDSTGVSFVGDTLRIDCVAAGLAFTSMDTVDICITATDSPDICDPNIMAPYCWQFSVNFEGPVATLVFPAMNSIISCEDTSIIITIIDDDGVNESTIELIVDGITYTIDSTALTFLADTLHFALTPTIDGDTISFVLVSAADGLDNPLSIPIPGWFIYDLSPPSISEWEPISTDETSPVVWFLISDTVSGVNFESLAISTGTSSWDTSSPAVSVAGDTVFIDFAAAGVEFEIGDTTICIAVEDQPDFCAQHLLDECVTLTILPSGDRPAATLLQPDYGAAISCDDGSIVFVVDGPYDILTDSLGLIIGDTLRLVQALSPPGLDVSGDTVRFNLPGIFTNGDTVHFSPLGCDIYYNLVFDTDWFFVVDTEPPSVALIEPSSPSSDSLAPIELTVSDIIAGLDTDSIEFTVITPRSDRFLTLDSAVHWDGETLMLDPDELNGGAPWTPAEDSLLLYWHENETIFVVLHACDSALLCGANCTDETLFFYAEDDDTLPPELLSWTPESFIPGDSFNLEIFVLDSSELGPCCYAIIEGETLDVTITFMGDTFIVGIEGLLIPVFGQTLWVEIHLCDNDFDFENPSDIEDTFYNIPIIPIPGEGPSVEFIQPRDNEFTSCADGPVITVFSDSDGVDSSSVVFIHNSESLAVAWNGDTALIAPSSSWSDGETVRVALIYCEDILDNPGDTGSVMFIVDTSPPEIELISPAEGVITGYEIARFYITDALSGVQSVFAVVEEDTIELDPEAPSLSLEALGTPGETLHVNILVCDNALYCEPNCAITEFRFLPAPNTPCDAHPSPFTPNTDGFNDYAYFEFPDMAKEGAKITIMTIDGILVREIEFEPALPWTTTRWDGIGDNGKPLPPEIYIYVIARNGEILCKGTIVLAR